MIKAKTIPLTQGKFAIVDDDDYDKLIKYKWTYDGRYAVHRMKGNKKIYMHRFIMSPKNHEIIDHANGNRLDNRKENLRIANYQQNSANSKIHKHNTSGYRGVYRYKPSNLWRAAITFNGKQLSLGYFDNPIDAAKAYNESAKKLFGEFAKVNEITE